MDFSTLPLKWVSIAPFGNAVCPVIDSTQILSNRILDELWAGMREEQKYWRYGAPTVCGQQNYRRFSSYP